MDMGGATSTKIDAFESQWMKQHRLVTFDEAAEAHIQACGGDPQVYLARTQQERTCLFMSVANWLPPSPGHPSHSAGTSPRTREGFYHYRAGLPAATKRAIAFAPHADLLWLETAEPSVANAAGFATDIRSVHPGKKLVYNLSPSFNWSAHGFSHDDLRNFVWDLAPHGFVLQLISLAGVHSTATITSELAKRFRDEGMKAYVDLVQKREKAADVDVLTHQKWSGAAYMDGIIGASRRAAVGVRVWAGQYELNSRRLSDDEPTGTPCSKQLPCFRELSADLEPEILGTGPVQPSSSLVQLLAPDGSLSPCLPSRWPLRSLSSLPHWLTSGQSAKRCTAWLYKWHICHARWSIWSLFQSRNRRGGPLTA